MADEILTLSRDTIALLKDMADEYRKRIGNTTGRPKVEDDDYQASDTYVALIPADGIPARVGTEPGAIECDIWETVDNTGDEDYELVDLEFSLTVLNLSTTAIVPTDPDVDEYVTISKAKGGYWYVTGTISDGSADDGDPTNGGYCYNGLTKLAHRDCMLAILTESTGGSDTTTMVWNGVNPWVSLTDIVYFGTPGRLMFLYNPSSGLLELWLTLPPSGSGSGYGAYAKLVTCGDGCWMGGAMTGHVNPSGYAPCESPTLRICLSCTPCQTYASACCPDNPLPARVRYSITSVPYIGADPECLGYSFTGIATYDEISPGYGGYPLSDDGLPITSPGAYFFAFGINCSASCGFTAGGSYMCSGSPGVNPDDVVYTVPQCNTSIQEVITATCSPLYVEILVNGVFRLIIQEL